MDTLTAIEKAIEITRSLDLSGIISGATIAVLASVFANLGMSFVASRKMKKQYSEALEKRGFEKAIMSVNIKELGGYLYNTLGVISVDEYAKSNDKADRLHKYLSRIADLLSKEDTVGEPSSRTLSQVTISPAFTIPASLEQSRQDIIGGEVWNGLARLRRDLEKRLSKLLEEHDPNARRVSAGAMMNRLVKSGVITDDISDNLQWALSIMNRAIHGDDVSRADAEEAFWSVAMFYQRMGWS